MAKTITLTANQMAKALRQTLIGKEPTSPNTRAALADVLDKYGASHYLINKKGFQVSPSYLSVLVAKNLIPCVRFGPRTVRFRREELSQWLDELVTILTRADKRKKGATANAMQEAARRVAKRLNEQRNQ